MQVLKKFEDMKEGMAGGCGETRNGGVKKVGLKTKEEGSGNTERKEGMEAVETFSFALYSRWKD